MTTPRGPGGRRVAISMTMKRRAHRNGIKIVCEMLVRTKRRGVCPHRESAFTARGVAILRHVAVWRGTLIEIGDVCAAAPSACAVNPWRELARCRRVVAFSPSPRIVFARRILNGEAGGGCIEAIALPAIIRRRRRRRRRPPSSAIT